MADPHSIRHYAHGKWDRHLTCVICGADIPDYNPRFLGNRSDWARLNKKRHGRSVIVPATEVEETDLTRYPEEWMQFHRAILYDSATTEYSISGITCGTSAQPWRSVPWDADKARIAGRVLGNDRWNANYYMANLKGHDENREAGRRIGYPVHAHCWLLLDRVIGLDFVKQNLREFIYTVEAFWSEHWIDWKVKLGTPWSVASKHVVPVAVKYNKNTLFPAARMANQPCSPCKSRDLEDLVSRSIFGGSPSRAARPALAASYTNIPVDIALNIVDMLYTGRPLCREGVYDTRNLLNALQWKLPDSYWIRKSIEHRSALFEAEGRVAPGSPFDWATFSLGFQALMVRPNWFCKSGVCHRQRVLFILNRMKEHLSKTGSLANTALEAI
ncbi:hypothetical protein BDV12DRAFT_200272 [Aspergillus spectabilis]